MSTTDTTASTAHFIYQTMQHDIALGKHQGRVTTRFPPEPNGYLHLGHAKSICLNFGMAQAFNGTCHLRFDDTNPSKEDLKYVRAIQEDISRLGFQWDALLHASDYFEVFYQCAEKLIRHNLAFVCDLSADEVRNYRGTLTEPGRNSPYRNRSIEENLDLFQRMRSGEFADGSHTLRAKIDMSSGNINLRDPAIYRIRKITHQNTGNAWCIYPMYDYAHCISDAVEGITHSLCTLEFEDHRPLYDWFLEKLDICNDHALRTYLLEKSINMPISHPQQIEFARLNFDYTIMSKRKLIALVDEHLVDGWDDPRMPTISGARRRGFTPYAIRNFVERAGVTKQVTVMPFSVLENSVRDDLDQHAQRRMAVLNPLRLHITNLPSDHEESLSFANHPKDTSFGQREVPFSSEIWIEQEDFMEHPIKGFHRLIPNGEVRLRGVGIIKCHNIIKNTDGAITSLECTLDTESRHGLPGAARKVKGTIHWVSIKHAKKAEVRLYDRLFMVSNPDNDQDGKVYRDYINPNSKQIIYGWLEPALTIAQAEEQFQFERLGYFIADRYDHHANHLVFNRTLTLRDSWSNEKK